MCVLFCFTPNKFLILFCGSENQNDIWHIIFVLNDSGKFI